MHEAVTYTCGLFFLLGQYVYRKLKSLEHRWKSYTHVRVSKAAATDEAKGSPSGNTFSNSPGNYIVSNEQSMIFV